MGTPLTNFALVQVSTGYDAAAVSVALLAGHGSRLPSSFPYPLVWWNATDFAHPALDPNREIVTVSNKVGDLLTLGARAQEGTTATTKNTSGKVYMMVEEITAAMWAELNARALTQSFRGLVVRTDPTTAYGANHRVKIDADSIVMDDGEEVAGWSNVFADIAVVGAGGLDTGTEAADAWYEIWAAYNGTTKIGLLHRAKDHLLDEDTTTGITENTNYAIRDNAARTRQAQGFQLDQAGLVEFIDVKLGKVGAPTGVYWFTLETNNGGAPSDTALATSDLYDAAKLSTTSQLVRLPFRAPVSLSALTQYHLVMHSDITINASNYIFWRGASAGGYARGSQSVHNGASWSPVAGVDLVFRMYVTRNDTPVTLPAGYSKKAKVGYVYNNSASNFKKFVQRDRTVSCGFSANWNIGTLANTGVAPPALVSTYSFFPPTAVLALFNAQTPGGSIHHGIGQLIATDMNGSSASEADGVIWQTSSGAMHVETIGPVLVEYNGLLYISNGGTLGLHVGGFTW